MLTPARMHFEKVMAERRGHNSESNLQERTAYEQMLYRLRLDKSSLKNVQSDSAKAELKRKLLPNYQAWIDGVLASDTGLSDEVLTTVMIWSADCGNIADALRVGEYVLRHKLPMPDQYRRTAATVLVEEICNPVLAAFKANPANALVSIDLLTGLQGITANEDMPDQVRAKLFKALGFTLRLDQEPESLERALSCLREAMLLDPKKAGVTRDIENLGRDIKKINLTGTDSTDDLSVQENSAVVDDKAPPAEPAKPKKATSAKVSTKKTQATKPAAKKVTGRKAQS